MTATLSPVSGAPRAPETGRPAPRKRKALQRVTRGVPLIPAVGLLAVFLLGPVISSFYGSFTNSTLSGVGASSAEFVGFQNYLDLFASPDFPKSVLITLIFLVASAIQGAIFATVKAVVSRGGARAFQRLTGEWPGD